MTKKEIRNMMRRLKAERLSSAASLPTALGLQHHPAVCRAHTILLYHPLPDEVDTRPLLAALGGKHILLPTCVGDDLELRCYTGKTSTGAFGIEEPVGAVFTSYDKIEVAIIPGMAFTPGGLRLGRGKGYYDRLLPHLASCHKIGLCYDFQLVDSLPTETHDIPVDEVYVVCTNK